MKDDVVDSKRLINIKEIKELRGVIRVAQGLRIGALTTLGAFADDANVKKNYPALAEAIERSCQPSDSQHGHAGRQSLPAAALLVLPQRTRFVPKDEIRQGIGNRTATTGITRFSATVVLPNSSVPPPIVPVLIAYGAKVRLEGPKGKRELPLEKFFVVAQGGPRNANTICGRTKSSPKCSFRRPGAGKPRITKSARRRRLTGLSRSPRSRSRSMAPQCKPARVVLGYVAPMPWPSPEAEACAEGQRGERGKRAEGCRRRPAAMRSHSARTRYKVQLAQVARQARHLESRRRCRMIANPIASTSIIRISAPPCAGKVNSFLPSPIRMCSLVTTACSGACTRRLASAPTANVAEPGNCSSKSRGCHGTGKCE